MKKITGLILRYRFIFIFILHILFSAGALFLAFMLRFDFQLFSNETYFPLFLKSLPINIVIFLIFSSVFNLYQGIWRYVSLDDLKDIVLTAVAAGLVFLAVIVLSRRFGGYPRSIYLLSPAFFVLLNGGTRFGIRIFRESFSPQSDDVKNILIIGAGSAGNEVAKTLKTKKNVEYNPVGFIDSDKNKIGKRLQGIKVLGDISTIKKHIIKNRVREIFIAIPEATNKTVQEIVDTVKRFDKDMKFKILPSMLDIMSGKYQVDQIREVSINDLLSRPNIQLDDKHVRNQMAGKTVLITGAGGSIGSEISFQAASYNPTRLILLDMSEENAYNIDLEIKNRHPHISVHTVVCSILDIEIIEILFSKFHIDFICHAAAYKHVHLMEWNPLSSLKNNCLGTSNLVTLAEKYRVSQFIMISTDKAVNPKGMMGIAKRLSERVLLERMPNSVTKFNIVRFGNVLGSSGSVIPLFQKQIKEGGPVTVTSKETRRYFMSIPEAVQLVLQASSLNCSNTIFMLEMGDPIRILDLARNLIELSGLKVDEDIEIKITGMRPGEKIFEELLTADENLIETPFEKLRMQKNKNNDPELVSKFIENLEKNISEGNIDKIYSEIKKLIPEMKDLTLQEMKNNLFA